jgi:uncharacterized protein YidB (DUF937 family)
VRRDARGLFNWGFENMSSLDRLIEDAASRLGLGYRARSVVTVLTAYIATRENGLAGLGDQFERAGVGALFHGWCRGDEQPIVASQVERAIGREDLARLARRAGFPPGIFAVIVAELLPPLVDLLTTSEGTPPALRTRRLELHPGGAAGQAVRGIAVRGTLACLIGVSLIVVTSWLYLVTRAPPQDAAATRAVPVADARLSLVVDGDHVRVDGRLPRAADQRRVWNALVRVYGASCRWTGKHAHRAGKTGWSPTCPPCSPRACGSIWRASTSAWTAVR